MKSDSALVRFVSFGLVSALFGVGLMTLAIRLRAEQVTNAATHRQHMNSQSSRIVKTAGLRGRILDRHGEPLAVNRLSLDLVAYPEAFRPRKKKESTADNLWAAIAALEPVIGRAPTVTSNAVARHLHYELARPLTVWRDLTEAELARFSERARDHAGFDCEAEAERTYPHGTLAAHVLGRVGREEVKSVEGDQKVNYAEKDLFGREGLELRYDDFLRSSPGEERLFVDARGFAKSRTTLKQPGNGYDLRLTLDVPLQRAVEAQLAGCCGACVVLDPRDGAVLALASAPTYNLNDCVPVFRREVYARLAGDPDKPLLNRATAGTYAPGSTFKPITALAGLSVGWTADKVHECDGVFAFGDMRIRCSRTWGHGELDLPHALRESCNPYFCNLGLKTGTNALLRAARVFGLGARTGLDYPTDVAGLVPDNAWKEAHYHQRWYPGDLAQMSIGQGMLLVTPLQMARVAAALGTGHLVTPHLNADLPAAKKEPLPFKKAHLDAVREGMRLVVDGGTGRKAGLGVDAQVIGKTGTAEVGRGASRRKNTWFIAYVTPTATSKEQTPLALAMVIENGESGGGTTAPKVADVLKAFYNRESDEEDAS